MAEVLSIQQQRIEELQQALVQRRDKTEKLEKAQPMPAETKPKTTRKRSQ